MKAFLVTFLALLASARAAPPLLEQLTALSPKLGHQNYGERDQALDRMRTLIKDGIKKETALEAIRDLWQSEKDAEIRARLFHLASELFIQQKGSIFGFRFRVHRVLEIDDEPTVTISIEEVLAQSAALRAGLKKGDLVVGLNGQLLGPKTSTNDVLVLFRRLSPEKTHQLRVLRKEEELEIAIRPDPRELTADDKQILQEGFKKWLFTKKSLDKTSAKPKINP